MHILIVDDDVLTRRTMQRTFERAGYTAERGHRVSFAPDGDACRRIVAEDGPIDIIFMDGELGPGDAGPIIVFKLREAGCRAKIVMTSSHGGMVQAGMTAGADAFCDKVDLGVETESVLTALGIPPP